MTNDPPGRATLEARALKLAERGTSLLARAVHAQVVTVEVGREMYGLPVDYLREIVPATPIAPLPGLPAYLLGLASIRGEILSVVDLGEFHGQGKSGNGKLFAVVESTRGAVAFCIETVLGLRDVFEDEIAEDLSRDDGDQKLAHVVTKDLVKLIDVAGLLASEHLCPRDGSAPMSRGGPA